MKTMILAVLLGLALGCGKPAATSSAPAATAPTPEAAATEEHYGAEKIINDMTGKTTVDQGRKAMEKIKKISAQDRGDYKEVQGE